jgi:plastocyanin
MVPHATRLLLAALMFLGVSACGDIGDTTASKAPTATTEGSDATDADDVGDIVIEISDNRFVPDTAAVSVGDTAAWDFSTADAAHNVVFDDARSSEILEEGTWSMSFEEPGTYSYECTLHSGMTGQITVTS